MVIGFLYLKGRSNLFMHTKNTRELPTYSHVELLTPGFKLLIGNLTLFIGIYSKIDHMFSSIPNGLIIFKL